jgi:hypothetical protein
VRSLAKIEVVKTAAVAALVGALACYPRLVHWPRPAYPIWYLEAVLLLGGFVLWAFVFAWHGQYTGRTVFNVRPGVGPITLVSVTGIVAGFMLHQFVDPAFRARTPEDYPTSLTEWLAMTLFLLAFNQLFLVFAPFAWALRLSKRSWLAILFTVLFGLLVAVMKSRAAPAPATGGMLGLILIVRAAVSFLSVWIYARHGIVVTWWWGFLLQTRHLFDLAGDS